MLGRLNNPDEHLLYSILPAQIAHLKSIIRNKYAYIVPGQCTAATVKLSYLLDIPSHSGTFTKESLELMYDREEEETSMVDIKGDESMKRDFEMKREVKMVLRKLDKVKFANRVYSASVKSAR